VRITDSAIVAACIMSNRYITDRFLPDKAIDLIDEAASRLRLQQESKPEEIENLDRSIITIRIEIQALKKESDMGSRERLQKLEEELKEKQNKLNELTAIWKREKSILEEAKQAKEKLEKAKLELAKAQRESNLERASELLYGIIPQLQRQIPSDNSSSEKEGNEINLLSEAVTEKDIAQVVSKSTGIPLTTLMAGEKERLLDMEAYLESRVVGQNEAVRAICNSVRIARAGLHAHTRPLGSFFFLGPTGVGKTELAKQICEFLFHDSNAMTRIDMSEYMEKFSVSRLLGAPPGYVGYEEGGTLTEAVRRRPYQVVLFDEFEKAHREVSNVLLQVLDEGFLTDSQGRKVDFRNTIVIMTSNIGAEILAQVPEGAPSSSVRAEVMEQVRAFLAPELINRMDEIILFNRLTKAHMNPIVDIQLKDVEKLLSDKKIKLVVSPSAKEWLTEQGFDEVYGARPLKRVIQRTVLNPLSILILKGEIRENFIVHMDASPDRKELVFHSEQVNFRNSNNNQ